MNYALHLLKRAAWSKSLGNWLSQFWQGLAGDFTDLPDGAQAGQIVGRLLVAAVLGGILGYEREQKGKAAGMRTHVLVALAAAFFMLVGQQTGMANADLSRIIQGIAAGVGFIGAGTILKLSDQGLIIGLTTAASLYFTTAIGIAAGMGREVTAILGTSLGLLVLTLLPYGEQWIGHRTRRQSLIHLPNDGATRDGKFEAEIVSTPNAPTGAKAEGRSP